MSNSSNGARAVAWRMGLATAVTSLVGTALPASAAAHGLVGRSDLPLPDWLFAWAAAIVLVASFVALGALWQTPRLEHAAERDWLRIPRGTDIVAGAIGVAAFATVVYAGFAGTQSAPYSNLAPSFIYVAFWVGLVPVSAIFGNVFGSLSPWRAAARMAAWGAGRIGFARTARPYPARLGRWPAAGGILVFAWVELVLSNRDDPRLLATLALAYALVQLAGMYRYGIEAWTTHADAFALYFGLFAAMAPLVRRGDRLLRRAPLSGLTQIGVGPGSVALLCVIIGSTTFDGLSNGQVWTALAPKLGDASASLGAGGTLAGELAGSVGLALSVAVIAGLYQLGIRGMSELDRGLARGLNRRFVHTLVPIAFAYAMAHYLSLLVFQGQALGFLVSDPLGNGSNLIGSANWRVDYGVISTAGIWYIQTALLVGGHVAGLVLAHDRALSSYRDRLAATRSQYWMLAVMVGYTSLGLWLLSTVKV